MKATFRTQFKTYTSNAKGERVITLVLKGELTDKQILALDKLKAAGACTAMLFSNQAEIEDYEEEEHDTETHAEPHKGIAYKVDSSGSVEADADQVTMDEVIEKKEQDLQQFEKELEEIKLEEKMAEQAEAGNIKGAAETGLEIIKEKKKKATAEAVAAQEKNGGEHTPSDDVHDPDLPF